MQLRSDVATRSSISVRVYSSTAAGPTSLAAFDMALVKANLANFNLVRLSSVIPPGAVVEVPHEAPAIDLSREGSAPACFGGEWGDRLYAVWAFQSAQQVGEEAWAGVAWVQSPDDGRGLFVEHEGHSEDQVRSELSATLGSIAATRSLDHLDQRSVVVGARCEDEPVGALVIAPFATEPW